MRRNEWNCFRIFQEKSVERENIEIVPSDDQFAKQVAKAAYLETFVNGDEEGKTTFGLEDRFFLLDDDPLSEGTAEGEKKGLITKA